MSLFTLLKKIKLILIALEHDLLRQAAELRAHYGIKTPDAIQVAAALQTKCKMFITNDRRLPKIPGLKILQLKSLFEDIQFSLAY